LSDDWLAVVVEFLASLSNFIDDPYEKSSPKSEEKYDSPK